MSKHLPPKQEPEELEFRWGNHVLLRLKMWRLHWLAVLLVALVWAYLMIEPLLDYLTILTR